MQETPISQLVHIHCGQTAEVFSKWKFRDSIMALPGRASTSERRAQYGKEPLTVRNDMPARQYANAVAQQAVRAAAAVAMFTTTQ